jgi:hypothetical protein
MQEKARGQALHQLHRFFLVFHEQVGRRRPRLADRFHVTSFNLPFLSRIDDRDLAEVATIADNTVFCSGNSRKQTIRPCRCQLGHGHFFDMAEVAEAINDELVASSYLGRVDDRTIILFRPICDSSYFPTTCHMD